MNKLYNDNESWDALENLVLTTSAGRKLSVKSFSLHHCIEQKCSDELFENFLQNGCNPLEEKRNVSLLDKCFQEKQYKKSALLLVFAAYPNFSRYPPVIYCVMQIIANKCK